MSVPCHDSRMVRSYGIAIHRNRHNPGGRSLDANIRFAHGPTTPYGDAGSPVPFMTWLAQGGLALAVGHFQALSEVRVVG